MIFADQTNRTFFLHGGPVQGTIDNLPDELELRAQRLPPVPDWEEAGRRLATILGLTVSPLVSAAAVAKLAADAKAKAVEHRANCSMLVAKLGDHMRHLGLEPAATIRHRTGVAALGFLDAIHAAKEDDVVSAIAGAPLGPSSEAMATSIAKAASVVDALQHTKFELFEAAGRLVDDRAVAGAAIRQRVREAFERDELAVALASVLRAAESDAVRLLAATPHLPPPTLPPPPLPPPPLPPGIRVVEESKEDGLDAAKAKQVLDSLQRRLVERPGRRLSIEWRIEEREGDR